MMALGLVGFMACSGPAEHNEGESEEAAQVMDEMESSMEEATTEDTEMAEEATEATDESMEEAGEASDEAMEEEATEEPAAE